MLKEVKNIIKQNISEGITTKELDNIAEKEIYKLGGKPGFKGLYGFPGTICSSFNGNVSLSNHQTYKVCPSKLP